MTVHRVTDRRPQRARAQLRQTALPAAILVVSCAVLVACGARRATAQDYWSVQDPLAYFSTGFRFGGYVLTDDEAEDTYGGLGVFSFDLKYHFFDLPLALSTSFDFIGGDGDPDLSFPEISNPSVIDADADVHLFNWRLSAIFEPPPGYFGDEYGAFYFNPYIGGGIGLHYAWEEVDTFGIFFRQDRHESDTAVGFHGLAGVDFVFGRFFSAGVETVYLTSDVDGVISAHDFDGFMISAVLRFFF